ncbi:phosphoribosylformylglycinamidine cyclo-ligase [Segetibacter sp. 3557_3]|uniref:AIR synthase-related protein n=1 Tax=Segetibacter sp. 3557_3 TaxID=2547429 RepID=UPI0010587CBB|nr:AIR synthase-related protein [Segetibacter sp. 3557_3]TDH26868.1 phosphoribosylformylglycinamidine cyclo-ligase [Segetibacter sp. 3557_3]
MSLYSQRGVSAQKEEVHAATRNLSTGLYPNAFCKVFADTLGGDEQMVNVMHADGAGTKSILAYLYWKETGDVSVWKGIAQDAVIMNLDDLLCVGIYNNILFSSTIDRNKAVIPAEVLSAVINGTQEVFEWLHSFGINIHFLGGETADVGDVVRTIAVNGTMTARYPKEKLVTNDRIAPGDVIVGVASFGKAHYESEYNSGIGSNGLTSARHDVLDKFYAREYSETYAPTLPQEVVYIGKHRLTDPISIPSKSGTIETNIGKLILSPTRTYAPFVKAILENNFDDIHGMIHCSGGGQTKCLKYLPAPLKIIKDNLFSPPEIFELIRDASKADYREMYQVFNMGHRLEVFTSAGSAANLIRIASLFGLEAKVIGRVEASGKKELLLQGDFGEISFEAH